MDVISLISLIFVLNSELVLWLWVFFGQIVLDGIYLLKEITEGCHHPRSVPNYLDVFMAVLYSAITFDFNVLGAACLST